MLRVCLLSEALIHMMRDSVSHSEGRTPQTDNEVFKMFQRGLEVAFQRASSELDKRSWSVETPGNVKHILKGNK